ncbi:unnamed protein product, partial [Ectocarpus sp. 12 AP-2014]
MDKTLPPVQEAQTTCLNQPNLKPSTWIRRASALARPWHRPTFRQIIRLDPTRPTSAIGKRGVFSTQRKPLPSPAIPGEAFFFFSSFFGLSDRNNSSKSEPSSFSPPAHE